jgi:outer membrane lipoprotein SlyB
MLVKNPITAAILAASVIFGASHTEAAGCLKGAAVGAIAGHYAHHHAILGAIAGCAIGHHLAAKNAKQAQLQKAAAKPVAATGGH